MSCCAPRAQPGQTPPHQTPPFKIQPERQNSKAESLKTTCPHVTPRRGAKWLDVNWERQRFPDIVSRSKGSGRAQGHKSGTKTSPSAEQSERAHRSWVWKQAVKTWPEAQPGTC